jgi:hypothetical protein
MAAGGGILLTLVALAARWALRDAEPEPPPIALTAKPVVHIAPDPVPSGDAAAPDAGDDAAAVDAGDDAAVDAGPPSDGG